MAKSKKETNHPLSSKDKIQVNKNLLPEDLKKPEKLTSGPASEKKDTISPEKTGSGPIGRQGVEHEKELEALESSGLARALFCGGFDFVLVRQSKSRLTDDEKAMLQDPLDKIEIKIMGYLPDVIRKHASTASPILELLMACNLIYLSRRKESPIGPASEKKDKISPEKQVSGPIGQAGPGTQTDSMPDSLKPIIIKEDNKPTP